MGNNGAAEPPPLHALVGADFFLVTIKLKLKIMIQGLFPRRENKIIEGVYGEQRIGKVHVIGRSP